MLNTPSSFLRLASKLSVWATADLHRPTGRCGLLSLTRPLGRRGAALLDQPKADRIERGVSHPKLSGHFYKQAEPELVAGNAMAKTGNQYSMAAIVFEVAMSISQTAGAAGGAPAQKADAERKAAYGVPISRQANIRPGFAQIELAGVGRPAPAALPSDCCDLLRPSPTRLVAGHGPLEPAET